MSEEVWKFSRSHDQTYVDCPYKAYLEYYYGGKGIVRGGLDIYQATGTLTHEILHRVMVFAKDVHRAPDKDQLRNICTEAKEQYRVEVLARGFDEVSGELELEMARQMALAEGLAMVWTLKRLPLLLEEYRIVATEEEHEVSLGDGLVLMSRPDGVLERLSDGEYLAGPEFKTTGWMSTDYIEQWRFATQILSHTIDVEATCGKKPVGVQMEFLYKGGKRRAEDGTYTYYSPLVRAYRMKNEFGGWEYGFDSALGRKRDWEAFEPYVMGMDAWINHLPDEEVEKMLFSTVIYRDDRELERWKRQMMVRQSGVRDAVKELTQGHMTAEAADNVMAKVFPARLDHFCFSNMYHKKCSYLDVCFNRIDDPIGSGAFVERTPHHSGEFEEGE